MGHHFVPQAYLRAFQNPDNPGTIWTYPRKGEPRLAAIKNVAQSSGFYDSEIESDLNTLIEAPANPILDMLRRGEPISSEQRYRIALYVGTMIKRVPRSRERGKAIIPEALDQTVARLRNQIIQKASKRAVEPERVKTWLSNLDAVEAQFREQPPSAVFDVVRLPWPSRAIVDTVFGMQWRILCAEPPEMFITGDNPAFFFEDTGIARETAELCFPLSPTRCLHCSHARIPDVDIAFMPFDRETVREMNRRIATAATSIVMAHVKCSWPMTLLRRKPDLRRINWAS